MNRGAIMKKGRVIETSSGIQGEFNVSVYDRFQRTMRDRGLMETKSIIRSGINRGTALEIGPGPGYLGLEWLKQTRGTRLKALEISPDMIAVAGDNAREYGLEDRWEIFEGSGENIPLGDAVLDAVFSCGSLHEWSNPGRTFDEIIRVLKPGGKFFVGDLRRDILPPVRWFMRFTCKPREIRPGFDTSIRASYTAEEISSLLAGTSVRDFHVRTDPFGLSILGARGNNE